MKKNIFYLLVLFSTVFVNAQNKHVYHEQNKKIDDIVGLTQAQKELINSSSSDIKNFIDKEIANAFLDWDYIIKNKGAIANALKSDFIAYHFYSSINESEKMTTLQVKENLKSLAEKQTIDSIINSIVIFQTQKLTRAAIVKREKPNVVDDIEKNYSEKIKFRLKKNIEEYKPLNYRNIITHVEVKKIIDDAKEKSIKEKNELEYISIKEKAELAGIDKIRVQKLISLIKKKDNDLLGVKNMKYINTPFFDLPVGKTKQEIMSEFKQEITHLISLVEYEEIVKNDIIQIPEKKASEELQKVTANYEVTKEQEKSIKEMFLNYYLKDIVTKQYYSYNSSLRKQKMSGLRYRFEKEYRTVMQEIRLNKKNE